MTRPLPSQSEDARVLLLVGVYRADWDDPRHRDNMTPVVAGSLDRTVWEHETDEETNARWAKFKEAFDPSGVDYDWREVWVSVDATGLRAPFEIPEAKTTIVEGPS